jgi:hypothetical protein
MSLGPTLAAAAPAGGAATNQVIRSFRLSDYRYDSLRRSPEPAERERVAA